MLGMPGAGKGTQAERLARQLGIPHVSTGAIFREAVQRGTDLGRQAKAYMDRGELVPDSVTVAMVRERLQAPDCRRGFVLDGFPRNLEQARALDEALAQEGVRIEAAIDLVVPVEEAVRRITSRRVCPRCGATYGAGELAAPGGVGGEVCPRCGAQLVQRDDDREEVVRQRLRVYEESTRPLVDYYAARGVLVEVTGTGSVDEVAEAIAHALRGRGLGIDRG